MRTLFSLATLAILLLIAGASSAQITQAEFLKVKSNETDLLLLEKEWKAVHQKRMEDGHIVAWYLMKKHFGGTADEYDYVALTVFPTLENAGDPFPQLPPADLRKRTSAVRDIVRTEIFDTPIVTEIIESPPFFQLSFVLVEEDMEEPFLQFMFDVHKPGAEALIKSSVLTTWSVYRQLYPRGHGNGYNYVTVAGFATMKRVAQDPPEGWDQFLAKNYPGANPKEIRQKTYTIRELIRMEVWERKDQVVPK